MWVKHDHHGFYECMSVSDEGFCGEMMLSQNEIEKLGAEDAAPFSFYIYDGVTGMGMGCLDFFHGLKELRIADTVTEIGVSPELEAIMKKNRTIIRGSFDSYADKFAKEYRLPFLHDDIELGRSRNEYEGHIITLRFHADGRPYIEQNCITGGISAGCSGGCEKDIDLPMNFYKKMTAEDIADLCWGSCYSKIKSNKKLADFLKKADAHGGYMT
ncbi:MAG: hypothetical protein IKO47_05555 [Ruminococcus sp.]|nr:hypothetical protein [Ruminococcus sp.]